MRVSSNLESLFIQCLQRVQEEAAAKAVALEEEAAAECVMLKKQIAALQLSLGVKPVEVSRAWHEKGNSCKGVNVRMWVVE